MPESTLALQYKDLVARTGFFLGFGRGEEFGEKAFTPEQKNDLTEIIKSGLSNFYWPAPIDGVMFDWSFLRPVADVALASGGVSAELPDDYGGIEGQITVGGTTSQSFYPLRMTNEGTIRESYARYPGASGQPECAAERPIKGTDIKAGQRKELVIYPAADTNYTLTFAYYILPEFLSGTRPYAYGGAQHAETLLESCLAIAEQRMDDAMGVHTTKFKERLAASMNMDRRNKPALIGPNLDRSDGVDWNWRQRYLGSRITYNGQLY